jgi:hypothetical protein
VKLRANNSAGLVSRHDNPASPARNIHQISSSELSALERCYDESHQAKRSHIKEYMIRNRQFRYHYQTKPFYDKGSAKTLRLRLFSFL